MTEKERLALIEFLSALKLDDLIALATTITLGMLNPQTAKDAVECIILHSTDFESVLKRKKITKDYLFAYLHSKKIEVPASADKSQLIRRVLELWLSPAGDGRLLAVQNSLAAQPSPHRPREMAVATVSPRVAVAPASPRVAVAPASPRVAVAPASPRVAVAPAHYPQPHCDGASAQDSTLAMMAVKFAEWFYGLLNSEAAASLSADHFWNDSLSRVKIVSDVAVVEDEEALDGESSVALFQKLAGCHRLHFSPNLTASGLRVRVEPHGGVLVLVCGTLHQGAGNMVGVYEQVFILFQDPLTAGTWKVRRTEMNLKSSNTPQGALGAPPKVIEGEFVTKYALAQASVL